MSALIDSISDNMIVRLFLFATVILLLTNGFVIFLNPTSRTVQLFATKRSVGPVLWLLAKWNPLACVHCTMYCSVTQSVGTSFT